MTEPWDTGNAPRVAALLRDCKEILIEKWIQRVIADPKVPEANKLSKPDLVDHIPKLIDRMVEVLSGHKSAGASLQPAPPSESAGRKLGGNEEAKKHADHRFQERYSMAEAMRELSHFRAALMELCFMEGVPLDGEGAQYVHAIIDEGMSVVATSMEQAANEELRRDAMFRDRFMGILGHDLRNPLAAIRMAAKLMLRGEDVPEAVARPVQRIVSSADRMARLISDLLDLTRSRFGGDLPIERKQADLHAICRQTIGELESQHPTCSIVLEVQGTGTGFWDPDRLAQVVSNIVGNAVTYSSAGRPVRVSTRDVGEDVIIEVHNEGPTIPREAQAILFDPFRQGPQDARAGRSSEGLGLGLFIAKQIIETHGGSIEVMSEPGQGTLFTVRFPRGEPPAPPPAG